MIEFIFNFKKYNLIIYIKQNFKNWSNLYTARVCYTVPFPYPPSGEPEKKWEKVLAGDSNGKDLFSCFIKKKTRPFPVLVHM